jgi:hypothetical protein
MKPTGEVHPAAALFPLFSKAEIDDLAADIKTNGLQHPIVLLPDGTLLEGRNRLAACKKAQVEPEFVIYDGDDPWAFVMSANVHRRHLSSGQRAMALAIYLVETGQRVNGRFRPGAVKSVLLRDREEGGPQGISKAGFVLDHAPDLVEPVMEGALALDAAYNQTREAADDAARGKERLDALRLLAPDLADKVSEEALTLDDAERQAEHAQRVAKLPDDLAVRVRDTGLSLEEAEVIIRERARRVAAWAEKVELALDELDRMAGNPIPAELNEQLSERSRRLLPVALRAIERKEPR